MVALTTVPSNLGCAIFFGLMVLMTMGTAVSIAVSAAAVAIGAVTWACAKEHDNQAAKAPRATRRTTSWQQSFIRNLRWRCEATSENEYPAGSWPAWRHCAFPARPRGQ